MKVRDRKEGALIALGGLLMALMGFFGMPALGVAIGLAVAIYGAAGALNRNREIVMQRLASESATIRREDGATRVD